MDYYAGVTKKKTMELGELLEAAKAGPWARRSGPGAFWEGPGLLEGTFFFLHTGAVLSICD